MTSDDDAPSPNRAKEAKLAEALRANLRRRKQGPPGAQPVETPLETAAS